VARAPVVEIGWLDVDATDDPAAAGWFDGQRRMNVFQWHYDAFTIPPGAARVLAKGLTKKDPHQQDREKFERLTERERDVLRLTAQGYSAPEIGEKLFISPKTVDTYKQRINEKLGLSHRADYVQLALRLGLLARD